MRLDVRSKTAALTPSLQDWSRSRVESAIGRFAGRVRAVRVRFGDLNGPRGGPDQHCKIEATLAPGGTVVAEVVDRDLYAAISRAAERLGRRVRDQIGRVRRHRRG